MLTALGKELRKLRIDDGTNMANMARAIGVSTAMLSAIETGRKKVPSDFVDRLMQVYPELIERRAQIEALVNLANKEVRVNLDEASEEDAQLVTELARRFSDLSDKEKDSIRNMLGKRG